METVNHPDHYKQGGIDVIEAFTKDCSGPEAFYVGNIIKYICRFKKKNGIEDLKKAEWYLSHLIEYEEGEMILNAVAKWCGKKRGNESCEKKIVSEDPQKSES